MKLKKITSPSRKKQPDAVRCSTISFQYQVCTTLSFLLTCSLQKVLWMLALCLISDSMTRLVVASLCHPALPTSATNLNKATLVLPITSSPSTCPFIAIYFTATAVTVAVTTANNNTTFPNVTTPTTIQTTPTYPFFVTQFAAANATTAATTSNDGTTIPIITLTAAVGYSPTTCPYLAIYFAATKIIGLLLMLLLFMPVLPLLLMQNPPLLDCLLSPCMIQHSLLLLLLPTLLLIPCLHQPLTLA